MTASQMDAATRVKTLIALTEELTAIFDRENAALKARRTREIAPLQSDKSRLASAYAESIRAIATDRNLIAGASAGLMEKLKAITQHFERRAGEQRALLDGARIAAEGVLKAVADEARAATANPAYDPAQDRPLQAAPAIAVDETA